jgi:hypothetical protein
MSVAFPVDSSRSVSVRAFRPDRIAGLAGLAFAAIVGGVNVAIGSVSPPATDAGASEILAFLTDNKTLLAGVAAAIPFAVISLFIFISSVFSRLSDASPEAALWTRVGAVGIVMVEVMFLIRMIFEFVLIANADALANETVLVETLWQLAGASTVVNGLALAVALLGLSRAASIAKLIPRWQELFGFGAAAFFILGAVAVIPSLEGSQIGIVGLIGFAGWVVWLATTSVRLLRSEGNAV